MHQDNMTTGAAIEPTNEGGPADAAAGATSVTPAHPSARGLNVGRVRVCYLKSTMQMGWGHDEGDSASRTLFALSNIYEADRRTAFRIIAGRHSIWFFF